MTTGLIQIQKKKKEMKIQKDTTEFLLPPAVHATV